MHYRSAKGKEVVRNDDTVEETDSEDNTFNLNNDILFDEEFSTARAKYNALFNQGMDNDGFRPRSRFNILLAFF